MKHFLDDLDTQLRSAAIEHATAQPVPAPRRNRRLTFGTAAITVPALAAVVAVVLASGGATESAQAIDLPIMQRQATDASSISTAIPAAQRARLDFSQARTFASRYGRGYVVPARDEASLCLVVPDVDKTGYGVGCATVESVKAAGLVSTLTSVEGMKNPSEFVAILPAGATNPTATFSGGRRETIMPDDGVVVVQASTDMSVSWGLRDGTVKSTDVEAFEPAGTTSVWCGDSVGLAVLKGDEAYDRRTLCAPLRRAERQRRADGTRLAAGDQAIDCGKGDIRIQRSTEVTGSICRR